MPATRPTTTPTPTRGAARTRGLALGNASRDAPGVRCHRQLLHVVLDGRRVVLVRLTAPAEPLHKPQRDLELALHVLLTCGCGEYTGEQRREHESRDTGTGRGPKHAPRDTTVCSVDSTEVIHALLRTSPSTLATRPSTPASTDVTRCCSSCRGALLRTSCDTDSNRSACWRKDAFMSSCHASHHASPSALARVQAHKPPPSPK